MLVERVAQSLRKRGTERSGIKSSLGAEAGSGMRSTKSGKERRRSSKRGRAVKGGFNDVITTITV